MVEISVPEVSNDIQQQISALWASLQEQPDFLAIVSLDRWNKSQKNWLLSQVASNNQLRQSDHFYWSMHYLNVNLKIKEDSGWHLKIYFFSFLRMDDSLCVVIYMGSTMIF